ncbi:MULTISPECIES: hypothetical protein [unclassified Streptomyces]|uniref:hypothetical protein n=1 Tax=unclassified Streptomyces TaxID=2593676 RepID=UPI002E3650F9|nr:MULTISPECIES: hypothetical protein [unclassified Streptomyces]WUC68167.1 hypothetical protein OG861_30165 [Streptomyces sp. NBC_00539]
MASAQAIGLALRGHRLIGSPGRGRRGAREAGCPTTDIAHTVTSGLVHLTVFASMTAPAVHARSSGPVLRTPCSTRPLPITAYSA